MDKLDEILSKPESVKFLNSIGLSVAEVRFYYSLYQESKKENELTPAGTITVTESDTQKQYISFSGQPTSYLVPTTFAESQKKAFIRLSEFLKGTRQDDFLMKELQYKSVKDLDKSLMPVQKDVVTLFIKNFRS